MSMANTDYHNNELSAKQQAHMDAIEYSREVLGEAGPEFVSSIYTPDGYITKAHVDKAGKSLSWHASVELQSGLQQLIESL